MPDKQDAAEYMVSEEKRKFKEKMAAEEQQEATANREKLHRLRVKVETFLVNKGCVWMGEFLASQMMEHQFTFHVPGHKPILLCFGGSHGQGQWVVEPNKGSPGIPHSYNILGEALLAAEQS